VAPSHRYFGTTPPTSRHRIETVRVGLNYRFNWGKGKGKAPVVAKY